MRTKGAAGPDDIPPSFLKALGPRALSELLAIFNASFRNADCPQMWRNAIIIPLLKAGKPASDLASYRPVSLTSCLVKLLERILADRLYHLAESSNWFSKYQAGFRKGRSCEDQILRIVQAIDDGFHSKPMKRSVLALLDFSKAYDTVWREKLLSSMMDKGVPAIYIRWLHSFLRNRRARVRLNTTTSSSRLLKQGLPQGSVLAPLLFLFYIDNLAELLPDCNVNAMFADDVSILASSRDMTTAQEAVQASIDIVVDWSKRWKLTLNAGKSESAFFSTWTNDAKWRPSLHVDGKPIPFSEAPRFLGVQLDRQLTFNQHIDTVTRVATSKLRLLRAVTHSDWGWRKKQLRTLYTTFVKSKLDYASAAWQPWISTTNMDRLERAQNKALRIITGQYQSAPKEALQLEAGMNSYTTTSKRSCLLAMEKALRSAADHPKRIAFEPEIAKRIARTNWRTSAKELATLLPDDCTRREHEAIYPIPPWEHPQRRNPAPTGATSLTQARSAIRKAITDGPTTHERTRAAYAHLQKKTEDQITTRADQVLIARLRSGHHIAFNTYKHRLDESISPACPACNAADHTLEHWLVDCDSLTQERQDAFGPHQGTLGRLTSHPLESIAFARRTLLLDATQA